MDYYLEDLARLEGQPKRTIGDYVEQKGILVPSRFDSVPEARVSGLPIIARSEHQQDYNGVSNLGESFRLTKEHTALKTIEGLTEYAFRNSSRQSHLVNAARYCALTGISIDNFRAQSSHSLWKIALGANLRVVADTAIAGRYHVVIPGYVYGLFEDNKLIKECCSWGSFSKDDKERMPSVFEVYEKVRRLERFDPNNCPIMELVLSEKECLFLQYHRGADFSPADFILDREPEEGEIEAQFVRGATKKQGQTFKIVKRFYSEREAPPLENEDGAYRGAIYDETYNELMYRARKIQVVDNLMGSFGSLMSSMLTHSGTSKMFKSEIFLVHEYDAELGVGKVKLEEYTKRNAQKILKRQVRDRIEQVKPHEKEDEYFRDLVRERKENACVRLHVVSDGRRAFVHRLEE